MVIRGELARKLGIATLSDASRYQPGWKLGVGYEFLDRPDGLAALKRTYRLPLAGAPVTMDLGLIYRALEQDQVTMAAGSATDGLLSVLDVVVLKDDLRAFPPYQGALVVRPEPVEIHSALRQLSGTLSEQIMRDLNHAVEGKRQRPREAAASFLRRLSGKQP
jgi:glycine betaine/choline ABC-type transport system substrate-binding protein